MLFNRKNILTLLLVVTGCSASSVYAASSQDIRSQHHLGANVFWQPTSLVIPSAKGANVSFYAAGNWAFDAEFSSATLGFKFVGLDVADVNERKLTLQARRFIGNSFNMIFGAGHRTTETTVIDSWVDVVLSQKSKTLSRMDATFVKFGLANQWQFNQRYTFMVDWVDLEIPISAAVTESAADSVYPQYKADVEHIESVLKFLPSGGTFKMQIGILF